MIIIDAMKTPLQFKVRRVDWAQSRMALAAIRRKVFVEEQHVPEELEWDGLDDTCLHVIAESVDGVAVGTGRLLPDAHIGRMAVLKEWRRRGVGRALMEALIAAARERGFQAVELSAQTHAIGFYQRFGFTVISDEYPDAGIPHRTMRMTLS